MSEPTIESLTKQLADIQAAQAKQAEDFKAQLAALTNEKVTLETNLKQTQEEVKKEREAAQALAFKTEFPEIPYETVAGSTFEEKRAAAAKLKEIIGTVKSTQGKTVSDWQGAGRISALTDAEKAAQRQAMEQKKAEAVKAGNAYGVTEQIVAAALPTIAGWINGSGKTAKA